MNRLHRLAAIGSRPIGNKPPDPDRLLEVFRASATSHLLAILSQKNGFYAFEGALHVFPDVGVAPELGLYVWNQENLWKADYRGMADATVFFAEDAFGT